MVASSWCVLIVCVCFGGQLYNSEKQSIYISVWCKTSFDWYSPQPLSNQQAQRAQANAHAPLLCSQWYAVERLATILHEHPLDCGL